VVPSFEDKDHEGVGDSDQAGQASLELELSCVSRKFRSHFTTVLDHCRHRSCAIGPDRYSPPPLLVGQPDLLVTRLKLAATPDIQLPASVSVPLSRNALTLCSGQGLHASRCRQGMARPFLIPAAAWPPRYMVLSVGAAEGDFMLP
jgi:hypothetical protein